jgi:hypothetical protein
MIIAFLSSAMAIHAILYLTHLHVQCSDLLRGKWIIPLQLRL